jgi:hypothetical protein
MASRVFKMEGNVLVEYCGKGKSVEIPSHVSRIGKDAFRGCVGLKNVEYWDSVDEFESTIGEGAFAECEHLVSILFGVQVTEIGGDAFRGCISLRNIFYLGNAEDFSYINVGENNEALQNATVYFYSDKTPTCEGNFWYYADGKAQIWEDAAEFIIKDGVLKKYTGAGEEVVVPSSVVAIGARAFLQCGSLQKIVLPEGVTEIGEDAFRGCKSLEMVVLPESLTTIHRFAFAECDKVTSMNIPASVEVLPNGLFSDCTGLIRVTIPKGVTSIDIWAFSDCKNLAHIELPDGVTELAFSTFYKCLSLESIVLPRSLTFIESRAFAGCEQLSRVFYKGDAEAYVDLELEDYENECYKNATKYYYSEEKPIKEGNYWHYIDGMPIAW